MEESIVVIAHCLEYRHVKLSHVIAHHIHRRSGIAACLRIDYVSESHSIAGELAFRNTAIYCRNRLVEESLCIALFLRIKYLIMDLRVGHGKQGELVFHRLTLQSEIV